MRTILFLSEYIAPIRLGEKRETERDKKPNYEIGETIYVRESTAVDETVKVIYRGDTPDDEAKKYKWTSARFMPAERARLFLKVTDIEQNFYLDDDSPAGWVLYFDLVEDKTAKTHKPLEQEGKRPPAYLEWLAKHKELVGEYADRYFDENGNPKKSY